MEQLILTLNMILSQNLHQLILLMVSLLDGEIHSSLKKVLLEEPWDQEK
jgi:hypothetical protein